MEDEPTREEFRSMMRADEHLTSEYAIGCWDGARVAGHAVQVGLQSIARELREIDGGEIPVSQVIVMLDSLIADTQKFVEGFRKYHNEGSDT